jgi:transcriptional regulator NrdR
VRRRRRCVVCNERFTTYEGAELNLPRVVKRDGSRVPFDGRKLRSGIMRAVEKRPISTEQVEAAVSRINRALLGSSEGEVSSQRIGELVMDELRGLDQVAYVRFASVYRKFEDVAAFREEIERLERQPDAGGETRPARPARGTGPQTVTPQDDLRHMARAMRLAGAASTPPTPIPASAACWCETARWWARASTVAPASRMPSATPLMSPASRTRRHRLCHARALLPSWPHTTLHRCLARGRRRARGGRHGRPQPDRPRPRPRTPARGRHRGQHRRAGASRSCAEPRLREAHARRLPYVRCKLAASLDGRTAMASGESRWITSDDARRDVHRLRARSSAVVTGIGTVLADDPSMNVRLSADEFPALWPDEPPRQPLRVVVDSRLRMPVEAGMLQLPGATLMATCEESPRAIARANAAGAEVQVFPADPNGRVDLHVLLCYLAQREINEVLIEAGPTLAGAAMQAGLVDELLIYQAPHLMGSDARVLLDLPGLERMEQRIALRIAEVRQIGVDLRLTLHPLRDDQPRNRICDA